MLVQFYTVEKKQNSTKLPTGTATQYNCTIKDSCSVLAPVIKLDIGLVTSPTSFNYAYIPDWNRYYFVNDWVFSSRLWKAQLSVDVLSTYKIAIGNYEGYVLRSSSNYSGDIVDTTYPQKVGLTGYSNHIKFTGTTNQYHTWKLGDSTSAVAYTKSDDDFEITDGYYYLTMLCTTSGSANKYNTYVMDYTNYASFITALFNTDYTSYSKGSLTNDVYKYLVDPLQWIVSVKWCPFRVPGYTLEQKTLSFGGLSSNTYTVTCAEVTEALGIRVEYVIDEIPSHPDLASRGKWVNQEPYIYVELDCQPFGSIALDRAKIPTDSSGNGGITIMWDVDVHTGDALARIYGTGTYGYEPSGALLGTISGRYMVDVPIAQTRTNVYGILGEALASAGAFINENASNLASAGTSGVTMSDIAGDRENLPTYAQDYYNNIQGIENVSGNTTVYETTGTVLTNIGSALTGANTTISTRGVQGAYIGVRDPFVDCWWTSTVEEDNEHSGRPYCRKVRLNTLSGFILCRDGDISLNATQQEKGIVGKYLTSGFFYE